jgi:hypothetical protein
MFYILLVIVLFTPDRYIPAIAQVPEITFESAETCKSAVESESFAKVRLQKENEMKAAYIEHYHSTAVELVSIGLCGRKPEQPV